MARTTLRRGLTVSQLERLLEKRRSEVETLAKERRILQGRLDAVDAKMRTLAGNGGGFTMTAAGRARNPVSLVTAMSDALAKAGTPLSVGEILNRVQESGYHSNAANFRAIINQTLIKERKRFNNTARGVYELRK